MKNFNWTILELGCYQKNEQYPDLVVNVKWLYTITDENDNTMSIENWTTINSDNIETFVPFEDLTEEVVISWLESQLDVEDLKSILERELDQKIDPPIIMRTLPI